MTGDVGRPRFDATTVLCRVGQHCLHLHQVCPTALSGYRQPARASAAALTASTTTSVPNRRFDTASS